MNKQQQQQQDEARAERIRRVEAAVEHAMNSNPGWGHPDAPLVPGPLADWRETRIEAGL